VENLGFSILIFTLLSEWKRYALDSTSSLVVSAMANTTVSATSRTILFYFKRFRSTQGNKLVKLSPIQLGVLRFVE